MSSASRDGVVSPRVAELCRLLLRVRLLLVLVALAFLPARSPDWHLYIAALIALVSTLLAYRYWRRITAALRRHPLVMGTDVALSFFVLGFGASFAPFLLYTVPIAAIAGLFYRRWGVVYVCTLQVLCYYVVLGLQVAAGGMATFQSVVGQPLYYPLAGFFGLWIRGLLDTQDEADAARREAQSSAAAAEERARLAREMHDSLAKTVRGIALAAAALPAWVARDPDRARVEAERLAEGAQAAATEARELLTELREREGELVPVVTMVSSVATDWQGETGIPVEIAVADHVDLAPVPADELAAILSEALQNIGRHADANRVAVALDEEDGEVRLTVTDDGAGFDAGSGSPPGHYGLVGMRERAERVGGSLDVTSAPGEGCRVLAAVPARSDPRPAVGGIVSASRSVVEAP